MLGGGGLFVTHYEAVSGAGLVTFAAGQIWLQSMPLPVLAHGLEPYLARQDAPQAAGPGAVGGILGDFMRGQ